MSEKRFRFIKNFKPITFVDMKTGKHYDCEEIGNLLNTQQAIIDGLKEKLCELGVSDVKINGKRINTELEEWLE